MALLIDAQLTITPDGQVCWSVQNGRTWEILGGPALATSMAVGERHPVLDVDGRAADCLLALEQLGAYLIRQSSQNAWTTSLF